MFVIKPRGYLLQVLPVRGPDCNSALLGRPRAVRIVWVRYAANSPADRPDYRQVNWRTINGVRFAELDSDDIHGLSAMIVECQKS